MDTIPYDIERAAREVREWVMRENGSSDGMCSEAAIKLHARLLDLGYLHSIECGTFDGMAHWWIWTHDHILDVTADQFGDMPEIVWGTYNKLPRYENAHIRGVVG